MKISVVQFPALAGIAVCGLLLLYGCRESSGKIPVNEQRAREHIISSTQGHMYIQSFRQANTELSRLLKDSAFLAKQFQLPVAESFNRDAIAALLNADSADGVRIYLGRDAAGAIRLVLVPIDKNGQDILTKLVPDSAGAPAKDTTGPQPRIRIEASQMVEIGQRCPTMCDSLTKF